MESTRCCVVGGGPAGMMLGFLLARAGVPVTILEKYKDFFRDFRGDTIHPSTLELMSELGILEDFLTLPHQELPRVGGQIGGFSFIAADFSHLPTRCKFIALMPQWDFLNFLAEKGQRFRTFDLRMEHEAIDLLQKDGQTTGVRVKTPAGEQEVAADLVIACDGRHSTLRNAAKLEVIDTGVPVDVLWFRVRREPEDGEQPLARIERGKMLVLIHRQDYFQAGLIVRKGSFDEVKAAGLPAFRESLAEVAPFLRGRMDAITDWEQVKLLSVQINRLRQWAQPGLLCIGDAAHAMSPAGGVGINLAIQDAVAAANLLAEPLHAGPVNEFQLHDVQIRRELPAKLVQAFQARAHLASLNFLGSGKDSKAPWELRAAVNIPGIQRLTARMLGLGIRPEHISTPLDPAALC